MTTTPPVAPQPGDAESCQDTRRLCLCDDLSNCWKGSPAYQAGNFYCRKDDAKQERNSFRDIPNVAARFDGDMPRDCHMNNSYSERADRLREPIPKWADKLIRERDAEITRLRAERDEQAALADSLQTKIGEWHAPYWPKSITEHVAELEATAEAQAGEIERLRDSRSELSAQIPCFRCFGTGGCDHVLSERIEFLYDAMPSTRTERVLETRQPEASGDVERARSIVDQFPVQEEFDAKECLIEEVAEAIAAARREGAEEMRERAESTAREYAASDRIEAPLADVIADAIAALPTDTDTSREP